MKKIIYGILFALLLILPISKVNACILTATEALGYGEEKIHGRIEINNIYIVGDKLYTSAVRADDRPAEIAIKDIVKYNTETGKWTYADGREALITLSTVKKVNGVTLTEDEISSYEELVKALEESNGAGTLIIKKDINGVTKPLVIDREVSIDGQGQTLHFSKQFNEYYAVKVNTASAVSLTNLNVVVDGRRNHDYRASLGIIDSSNVEIGKLDLDSDYRPLYIKDSVVEISDNIDISGAGWDDHLIIEGSSSNVTVANEAKVINDDEWVSVPSIYVEDATATVNLGPSTATVDNGSDKRIYANKDNADYTMFYAWAQDDVVVNTNTGFSISVDSTKVGNQDFYVKAKVTNLNGATIKLDGKTLSDSVETLIYTGNNESVTSIDTNINVDKVGTYNIEFTVYDHSDNKLEIKDFDGNKTSYYECEIEVLNEAPIDDDSDLYITSTIDYKVSQDTSIVAGKTYYVYDSSVYKEYRVALASELTQAKLDADELYEFVGTATTKDTEKTFKGNIRYEVLESPEGANVTIKYNGVELKELNDTTKETSNMVDFTGATEDSIIGTVTFEADTNGYYEIDLHLIDETGVDVSTDSLDSVYVGADENEE